MGTRGGPWAPKIWRSGRVWLAPRLLGVSKNRVFSPKSSILIGCSIIFTIHFGVPLFSETSCWEAWKLTTIGFPTLPEGFSQQVRPWKYRPLAAPKRKPDDRLPRTTIFQGLLLLNFGNVIKMMSVADFFKIGKNQNNNLPNKIAIPFMPKHAPTFWKVTNSATNRIAKNPSQKLWIWNGIALINNHPFFHSGKLT